MLNATTTAGAQLRNLAIIVICIALLAGINVVFNDYIVRVISTIFIFMILAVSYNLINGVTGQLSLEPNGFVAVGAYVTALLILSSDSKVDMFEMAAPSPWILSLHAGFLPALLISGLCGRRWRCASPCRSSGYVATTWPLSPSALGLSSRSSPLTTRKSPTAPSG